MITNLVSLVMQLSFNLRKASPNNIWPDRALFYLKREGLVPMPFRSDEEINSQAVDDFYLPDPIKPPDHWSDEAKARFNDGQVMYITNLRRLINGD